MLLLLATAVSGVLTACSNDGNDEPPVTDINQIIKGEWDSEFLGDVADINISTLNVNDTSLGAIDSRLVFGSNGKGYEIDRHDGIKTEFSYVIKGETLRLSAGNVTQIHKIIKYSDRVIYSLMEAEQSIFKMVKRD